MLRRRFQAAASGLALLATVAACGTPSTGATATPRAMTGPLVIGNFNPFTGVDASFGPEMLAGCYPAIKLINDNGGVLGHQMQCLSVDTRGDPADAVTAAQKMLATTTNLVAVMGPSSDEALATAPLINRGQVPMFADTGQSAFDKTKYTYFWRLVPPDSVVGYVMALWAQHQGYKRGAAVFGNDIGGQANVPTLLDGFKKLGLNMAVNETLALDKSSYRTEVEKVIEANPDVIFTEADPQTDATFLAEMQQLRGLVPVVGTVTTLNTPWLQAVGGAIGNDNLARIFVGVQPYAAAQGPAWDVFNNSLLASAANVPQPSQWSTDSYSMAYYDSINIAALAMIMAKTTDPVFFNSYITKVATAGPNAVVVHSYKEGKDALAAGKAIQYVGATGVVAFNQWHNSSGGYEVSGYQTNGQTPIVYTFTADQIRALTR
jgi:branched-chain amino acid transport system substrate-binding protein